MDLEKYGVHHKFDWNSFVVFCMCGVIAVVTLLMAWFVGR